MGWFDDLRARAEQSLDSVGSDITDFVKTRVTDAVVKVGEPQKGNQSAAQLAAGQAGGQSGIAGPNASADQIQNASQASQIGSQFMKYLPLIAVAGLAVVLFSRKGK